MIRIKIKAEDVSQRSGTTVAAQHRKAGKMRHKHDRRAKDARRRREDWE